MNLFLADIDGVLLSLAGLPHGPAIARCCAFAEQNFLGLVTGRDAAFLRERFLPALGQEITLRPAVERRVLVGAEYAGVLLSWTGHDWYEERAASGAVSPDLRAAVRSIAARYPALMFHEHKLVITTVGLPSRQMSAEEAAQGREQLEQAAVDIVALAAHYLNVEIHRTTKAVDIVPAGMSKAFGARVMLDRCGFVPRHVQIFGDAAADLALAEPFSERGIPYTFWYVGRQADLTGSDRGRFTLQFPSRDALFEEGMFEVLQQLKGG